MMLACLGLAFLTAFKSAPQSVVYLGDNVMSGLALPLVKDLGPAFILRDADTWSDAMVKMLIGTKPNYVLIGPGASVIADGGWKKQRDGFVPSIEKIIERFQSASSHPKVFLCLPPPVNLPESDPRKTLMESEVVPLLKQAARETDCSIIDFGAALKDRIDLVDGLQPTPLGYELLADKITETIFVGRKADWKVVFADSEETDEGPAKNAIDGDPETYWHTNYSTTDDKYPHELQVDTGSVRSMGGFSYMPRQDGVNGRVAKYEFYVSMDGKDWGAPVASGQFPQSSDQTKVFFSKPIQARYFKFRALSEQQGQNWASVGELDILKFYPKRP